MSVYVGWGGLSGVFDETKPEFKAARDELKALLTKEEYRTALKSTQYAHYTAEHVIRSMWKAVRYMGFEGGQVFEPGMGVGHFLGMAPPDIAHKIEYQGVEMDGLTADIASLLYPKAGVRKADFTKLPIPENTFDLAIGNPPFSDTVIRSDPKYAARRFMLHDYFFAKTIDSVRPGGLLAFVTSAGTMNKMDTAARQYLADRAAFVGGARLPSDTFKKNAGTEVTTDVLFFRKRVPGEAPALPFETPWIDTEIRTLPDAEGNPFQGHVSRYFVEHPEQVLGDEGFFDKLYKGRYAVHAREGVDPEAELRAALDRLPKDVMTAPETPRQKAEIDFAAPEHKDGSFYLTPDGKLMQFSDGAGRPVVGRGKGVKGGFTRADQEKIVQLVPVRDALRDVFAHDLAERPADAAEARARLNQHYDAFVARFGAINKAEFQYRRPTIVQQEGVRAKAREEARDRGEVWREGSFDPAEHFTLEQIEAALENDEDGEEEAPKKRKGVSLQQIARARAAERARLGSAYDEGSFNPEDTPDVVIVKRPNIAPFMDDPESYRLRAIEDYNDATGETRKKDIFDRSILTFEAEPQLKSAGDGVLWSLNKFGRFDPEKIAAQMGRTKDDIIAELGDHVFRVPGTEGTYQTADEYLSGDIFDKIAEARAAAASDPEMRRNLAALEAAKPAPLAPTEITMNLGMPWIPASIVEDFARDHLRIGDLKATHSGALGGWTVKGRSRGAGDAQWSTSDMEASKLLAAALNRMPIRLYDTVYEGGEKKSVFNPVATQAALDKVEAMKAAFQEFIEQDPDRQSGLADLYNNTMNRTVLRKYDGSYLTTPGVAADWSWRPHQQRVVARIVQSGNTYMAHAVGAGKTSAMIGAGMEQRRLGLIKKPMYVVPNHMLGQFTKEFYEQYPTARISVADERRFHTDRRKQFVANVAQDDLDAVIITHSAFKMIPISDAFQGTLIGEELDKVETALADLDKEDRFTIKKLENLKEKLEQRMAGAMKSGKDATNTFEELGVDHLFVDEAHMFRKLTFATRQSMKGIDPKGSDQAWDLYTKIRYLDHKNPGRAAVLASGTPVTNTMGELYSLSRFLQPEELKRLGLDHFDSWSSNFGDAKTVLEQTADGSYAPVTRFAKFVNMPELYKMVGQAMDIVTPAQLEQYVVRPKLQGGKRQFHLAPSTPTMKAEQAKLGARMKAIQDRRGPPQKGDDILLSVINDGRLMSIDPRFVDQYADPNGPSKLNEMIDNVHRIWSESKDQQFYDPRNNYQTPTLRGPATQMVFANLGVNPTPIRGASRSANAPAPTFSTYEWIRKALLQRGVPASEIAFIGEHKTHTARQKLFNDMNDGKVRILVGSTQKMGTGVNAQRRLIALHNLDPLWFPSDDEQRVGRALRQGNLNPEIQIHDYSTKGTYDATMWQMMGNKARFIEQFFRGDPELREMEDLGEASHFEQAAAMATTDERLITLTDMRQQLEKIQRRSQSHDREQYAMGQRRRGAVATIELADQDTRAVQADIARRVDTRGDAFRAKVGTKTFDKRDAAAKAMEKEYEAVYPGLGPYETAPVGELGGFRMLVRREVAGDPSFHLERSAGTQKIGDSSMSMKGMIASVEKRLPNLEDEVRYHQAAKAEAQRAIASLDTQIGKPFTGGEAVPELKLKIKALEAEIEASNAGATAPGAPALAQEPEAPEETTAPKFSREPERPDVFAGMQPLEQRAAKGPFAEPAADEAKAHFDQNHADLYRLGQMAQAKSATPEQLRAEASRLAQEMGRYMDWGDVALSSSDQARLKRGEGPTPERMLTVARDYVRSVAKDQEQPLYDAEAYHDVVRRWYEAQGGERPKFAREAPFYSALERNVERSPQNRASAEQWLSTLKNAPGVKKEELEWTGLEDWLRMFGKEPVSKEAVRAFVQEHGVRVEEHVQRDIARVEDLAPAARTKVEERAEAIWLSAVQAHAAHLMEDNPDLDEYDAHEAARDKTSWDDAQSQAIEELATEGDIPRATEYGNYAEPGGKDYTELLLTLPQIASPPSTHWDTEGVMAHVRFDTRETPDGKKALFIQEVQSDWHQKGRDEGYAKEADPEKIAAAKVAYQEASDNLGAVSTELSDAAWPVLQKLFDVIRDNMERQHQPLHQAYIMFRPDMRAEYTDEERAEYIARHVRGPMQIDAGVTRLIDRYNLAKIREREAAQDVHRATNPAGVAHAPFKASWPQLVMKRVIAWAAEHGYDRVAWTTGEQQSARYDLGERVGRIHVEREGDGRLQLHFPDNGHLAHTIAGQLDPPRNAMSDAISLTEDQIRTVFGADGARRIIAGAADPAPVDMSNVTLGGEGMRAFYDRNLVNITNDIVKKYGAKVGKSPILLHDVENRQGARDAAEWSVRDAEARAARREGPQHGRDGDLINRREILADRERELAEAKAGSEQPGFDITDKMRDAAQEGFPLFQFGQRRMTGPGSPTEGMERLTKDLRGTPYSPLWDAHAQPLVDAVAREIERIAPRAEIRPMKTMLAHGEGAAPGGYRTVGAEWSRKTREGIRQVVAWSLDSPNAIRTGRHEALHALRDGGLFSAREWKALEKAAIDRGWLDRYNIDARYPGVGFPMQLEEAIADRFSDWRLGMGDQLGGKLPLPSFVRELFNRLSTLLSNVAQATRKILGASVTADDILNKVESGEIGARTTAPDSHLVLDYQPKFAREVLKPEEKGLVDRFRGLTGAGADSIGRKVDALAVKILPEQAVVLNDALREAVNPMARGSPRAQKATKDFANALRLNWWEHGRVDKFLVKHFTPAERKLMWEAADQESVLRQRGREPGPQEGLNRLTPAQRQVVEKIQGDSPLDLARQVGITESEGLPSYVPRMVVKMTAGEPQIVSRATPGQARKGGNLITTTGQMRQRKYETVEETEAAAKRAFGQGATVVRDIRTLALANARLNQAIAGRVLINRITDIGKRVGAETVIEGGAPDTSLFFTIPDHPAFQKWRPQLVKNPETGKWEHVTNPDGSPAFERVPLWVSKEFEGPLKAVLNTPTNEIYQALMNLKGKTMGVIMYSPLMHNAVIWGKALPATGLKAFGPIYTEGNRFKNSPNEMAAAIADGLVPIGNNYHMTDVRDIAAEPGIVPGRSWVGQLFAMVPRLYDKSPEAGRETMRVADQVADFWHNTLLWDRIGDLQAGIYSTMRESLVRHGNELGIHPDDAGKIAAHFANRYAGALPAEAMSKAARMTADLLLFSRSFTLGNLGVYKDVLAGLPTDVQGQIGMRGGKEALESAQGIARRKAAAMLFADVALNYVGLILASGLALAVHQMFGDKKWKLHLPWDNEPGKENRVLVGYQADGTGIYIRLPTGKVGEDLVNWITHPIKTGLSKLNPLPTKMALTVITNDRGFGRKLWEPDVEFPMGTIANLGRVAMESVRQVVPENQIQSAYGLATGQVDPAAGLAGALLPIAGMTISHGAPGGPGMGESFHVHERQAFAKQENLPGLQQKWRDAQRAQTRGDLAGAAKLRAAANKGFVDLGINPKLAAYYKKVALNPEARMTKTRRREFMRFATPEERAKFTEDLAQ